MSNFISGTATPAGEQIIAQKKMPVNIITPPLDNISTSPTALITSDGEQFVACGPSLKERVWKLQAKKTVAMYRYSEIVCSSCGMRFDTMFRGKLHRKQEQTRPACFKASLHMYTIATMCPFCSKVFARVDDCAGHISRGCPSAPQTDVQSALFRWHCRDCEKSFLTWSSLRGHVIAKHEHFLMKEKGVDMEKKLRAHYMVPSEHDDFELPDSKPIPDELDFSYLGSDVATQHRKQQQKSQTGVTTVTTTSPVTTLYQSCVTSSQTPQTEETANATTVQLVASTTNTIQQPIVGPPGTQQIIPSQHTIVQTISGQQYVQHIAPLTEQAIITQSVPLQSDLSDDYTVAGLALCDLAAAAVESGTIDATSSTVEAAAIGISDQKNYEMESPAQGYVLPDGSITGELSRPLPTPSPSESVASKSSIRSSDREREKPVDLGGGIFMSQRGLTKDGKRIMHAHGVPMIRLSRYVCTGCDEVFLRVHQAKTHVSKCTVDNDTQMTTLCDFQCVFCSLVFKGPSMSECREHVKGCTKKSEFPQLAGNAAMNRCRYCATVFISKTRMYQHILARHPDESPVSEELIAKEYELATTADLRADITHQIQTISNPIADCNGPQKPGMAFSAEGQEMQEALALLGHTDMKAPGMFEDSPEPQQKNAMFSFPSVSGCPKPLGVIHVDSSGQLVQNAIDKLDATSSNVVISDDPGDHFHYICEHCKGAFTDVQTLSTHRQYDCNITALAHRQQHICPHCKHEFQHVVALKYHVLRCLSQECPPIIMGGRSARRRKAAGGDTRSVRAKSASAKLTDTLVGKTLCHADVIGDVETDYCKFRCRYCAKIFDKIMSMHSHILSRHSMMYQKVKFCDAKYNRALLPIIQETIIPTPHAPTIVEHIPLLPVSNESIPIEEPAAIPDVAFEPKARRNMWKKRREALHDDNSCSSISSDCDGSSLLLPIIKSAASVSIQTEEMDVRLFLNEMNYRQKYLSNENNVIDLNVIDLTVLKTEPSHHDIKVEIKEEMPDTKLTITGSVLNKTPAHSKNDVKRYKKICAFESTRRIAGVINLSHNIDDGEIEPEIFDGKPYMSEEDSNLFFLADHESVGKEVKEKSENEYVSNYVTLDEGVIADVDSNSSSKLDESLVPEIPIPLTNSSLPREVAHPKWKKKNESDIIVSVLKLYSKPMENEDTQPVGNERKRKGSGEISDPSKRHKHMWMCILCRQTFAKHSGWQDHMLIDHAPLRVSVDEDGDSYYGKHGALQLCGPVLSDNMKCADHSHTVPEDVNEETKDSGVNTQTIQCSITNVEEQGLSKDLVTPPSAKNNMDTNDNDEGGENLDQPATRSNQLNYVSADTTKSPTSTSHKYSQISNGTDGLAYKAVSRLLGQQAEALHQKKNTMNTTVQP